MVTVSKDKRVRRTQLGLRSALLELMTEHGYESLTVQQILDRAGIGRATFYLHYRSKEDLLRGSLEELRLGLAEHCRTAGGESSPLAFSLPFFRHVDGHRRLYRAVVGRESGVILDKQMRRLLADLVRAEVDSQSGGTAGKTRADFAAQYVAGALLSVVTWWLDRNVKLTAEEVDLYFRQMTLPAVEAIRTRLSFRRSVAEK